MTRFTSECDLCAELLIEYITASNEIVDRKVRAVPAHEPTSSQLAAALVDRAVKRRDQARQKLYAHKAKRH